MSDLPPANRGADERTPPKKSGSGAITSTATSGTAAEADILGASFAGGAYYSFQAAGSDASIAFKQTAGGVTLTTGEGLVLLTGQAPQEFWMTADSRYVEHIAAGPGTLRWWRSSPNYRDRG